MVSFCSRKKGYFELIGYNVGFIIFCFRIVIEFFIVFDVGT